MTAAKGSHNGYQVADDQVERLLVTGEHSGLLEDYFGEEHYGELVALAQRASLRGTRGGPRVLVLPGILGSKLGRKRFLFDDTLWFDPVEICRGGLSRLALPDTIYEAIGVFLIAYLKLKLHLKIAGFDVEFHPFDWRRSLAVLGRELMDRIDAEPADHVHIVAHSMGGLVTRAALRLDTKRKIGRFVMLGTPNHGSFAAVQALRGTYPVVSAVSFLDFAHSPTELAQTVFRTFPGLYQMLPWAELFSDVDLYDVASWPDDLPKPDPTILSKVKAVQQRFADPDDRFFAVAGVNQPTTTSLRRDGETFTYLETPDGDGTVPLASAELSGVQTYYVEEGHGSLPNNGRVASAVIDILSSGRTEALPRSWERRRIAQPRVVSNEELVRPPFGARSRGELGQRDFRRALEPLLSAESREALPVPSAVVEEPTLAPGSYAHRFQSLEIARPQEHTIELQLALGSLTEVNARGLVLGMFKGVEPAGAAGAIDEALEGAVKEFVTRRMFSGEVGEVFAMPTGRSRLFAESVLFAGLGDAGRFTPEVLEFVAENVVRTFVRTHVEEFATVLMAAGSGQPITTVLYHQLRGFLHGIVDADRRRRLRRITICELNPDRYVEIKAELYRLASTELFRSIRVLIDETPPLPPPPTVSPTRVGVRKEAAFVYLLVERETRERVPSGARADAQPAEVVLRSSLLSAGSKAAILRGTSRVKTLDLRRFLELLETPNLSPSGLEKIGNDLGKLVLPDDVAQGLAAMRGYHLVVVHDALASKLPWEVLSTAGWSPGMERGISRRYAADNLSVAKWLEERRFGEVLDILLITNPTENLPGAEQEAEVLRKLAGNRSGVKLAEIRGRDATRQRLLREFQSGDYDVVHYAGHAFFDAQKPSQSGIICSGNEVLSGADLPQLRSLPALVFFNACESGRVRGRTQRKNPHLDMPRRAERTLGLAEAFLRGGVANYVGTYWSVSDEAAPLFASTFYEAILAGGAIGEAIQNARQRLAGKRFVDWANYIHYGSYDFSLKETRRP